MIGREQWMKASAAWGAALWLVGCGQDAPPYDDLPLRDALRASPEVVASMSLDTRRELALRLDAAGLEGDDAVKLGLPETVTIDTLARVADEAREDEGHDALIVGEIVSQANDFVVRGENIPEDALGRAVVGPIFLRGRPGAQTALLEDAALRGRAGKWLRELSGRTETEKMVRTTGVPFGAWAFDDTLYVNASWLVAMSALEKDVVPVPVTMVSAPNKNPQSVDYNPYNLPGTIAECALQVKETCACGTSCTHEVTDTSFPTANDECAWVNQDSSHPLALCVLALLSIDDVRACMQSAGAQCSAMPVTTGDDALAFVQNATCMELLDVCLRDGYIPKQSSGGSSCNDSGSSSSGSSDSCSSCNNDCSKCNDSCSQCNDNWSDCNDNCSDCNQNCADSNTNANNCSGGHCNKCSIRPASRQSPLPAPFGTTFWLVAPVAYLLLRGRRRS
jgi:hypothetical protein